MVNQKKAAAGVKGKKTRVLDRMKRRSILDRITRNADKLYEACVSGWRRATAIRYQDWRAGNRLPAEQVTDPETATFLDGELDGAQ